MKRITDIVPQVKNKNRASIFLDGSFYCGMDLFTICTYKLKIGMEIDENKMVEIQRKAEFQKCLDYSINYLSRYIKTEREVYKKLKDKGYIDEIVVEVVDKLKELGLLNDIEYCERFIEANKNKYGKIVIRKKLLVKGVDKTIIESAINSFGTNDDVIKTQIEKYMKNKEYDRINYSKCIKYLFSKGYNYGDCKPILDKYWEK